LVHSLIGLKFRGNTLDERFVILYQYDNGGGGAGIIILFREVCYLIVLVESGEKKVQGDEMICLGWRCGLVLVLEGD